VWAQIVTNPEGLGPFDIYTPSTPTELTRLPSGHVAMLFSDVQLLGPITQGVPGQFISNGSVSVIDISERRVCPDAMIPGPADSWPRATMRGDTLLTVPQDVIADRAVTSVRRYLVSTESCEWVSEETAGG
jgi:hypothetical protein